MSVPKGKRSTSKFEVYHHAVKMRTEITKWLLRDFGIKPKERTLPYVAKKAKMTEEDAKALGELFDRYGLGDKILEDFPSWWITDRRIRVDEILARLMTEISLANSIYDTHPVDLLSFPQSREGRIFIRRSVQKMDRLYNTLFVRE